MAIKNIIKKTLKTIIYSKRLSGLLFVLFIFQIISSATAQIATSQDEFTDSFISETLFKNVSFIMDFSYLYRDVKDDELNNLKIPMFIEPGSTEYSESGLKLNYGEMATTANIDRDFSIFFDLLFTTEDIEIDELYAKSSILFGGFRFKVGRFLSNFGYHNSKHKHNWIFFDAPLAQKVFFGNSGLLEEAVQAAWKVPINFDLILGGEVARGENEESFGTESFGPDELGVQKTDNPNLYILFIDSNIPASNWTVTWGLSFAKGKSRINDNLESYSGSGIYGETMMAGADLSFKYNLSRFNYIELQNEIIYREITGDFFQGASDGNITTQQIEKSQIGAYSQVILKPFEYWRFGIRADFLRNNITLENETDVPEILTKYSGMIDLSPSEYTQIRLQFNYYDKTFHDMENNAKPVQEFIIQFNFGIGPYGAHKI